MMIRVRYRDNSSSVVDDSLLDTLVASDKIIEFRRSSGWVRIGRDPVRDHGVERRRKGCIINTYV